MRSRDAGPTGFGWRLGAATLLALAGVGLVASSLLSWLVVPTDRGGRTLVNGWGTMAGGGQDGYNLNDLMTGYATFRPGLWPTVLGPLLLICGVVLAVAAVRSGPPDRGRRRNAGAGRAVRVVAGVAAGLAVVAVGWSVYRLLQPDSAGVLEAGDGGPGDGQWVSLGCGLVAALAAAAGWWSPQPGRAVERVPGIRP